MRSGIRVRARTPVFRLETSTAIWTRKRSVVDLVVVSVKSTSNEELPELLQPMLKAGTIILTLQNGLGNYSS